MIKSAIDYGLYLVTDQALSRGRTLMEVVSQAVYGGVTCVQVRAKTESTRDFIDQARSIQSFLAEQKVPLIINDRLDVAQAVGADGIHLGQSDMPIEMARAIMGSGVGPEMVIGISAECLEHAVDAEKAGADYIGAGALFTTPTKADIAPPMGIEDLQEICESVTIPVVAIGGINASNSADVIGTGADGIAVVSAIVSADDCRKAAQTLNEIIRNSR